jgi:UDP-N-acetylglucosamine--N-acetylmuramyl-(pentapeptide) pyrophosphoryl-undecaprenol N-acetylglucosamine transferase
MPNVIFSKGGPSSFLVVFTGWVLTIPIVIHDSDAVPGLSNKISSFFVKKILLAFDAAVKYFKKEKTIIVGQPIDRDILTTKASFEDYQRFGLDPQKKIVVVLGGSQGSKFLNDLIVESLPGLLNLTQVVHQTGEKNYQDVYFYAKGLLLEKNPEKLKDYHPFPFINYDDLYYLLDLSDLVISRAGSGTIFELAALGKPSILIPIEEKVAGQHQVANAQIYDHIGACKTLEEKNAKPHLLIDVVGDLLNNKDGLDRMKQSALNFAKPDASLKTAEEIIKLLQ